jgi:F0F1-type ATP synthase assembly protein I
VVIVFFLLGWLVDSLAGTIPVFMVALTVLGIIGQLLRMWFAYDADMKVHEAELAAKRAPRGSEASAS